MRVDPVGRKVFAREDAMQFKGGDKLLSRCDKSLDRSLKNRQLTLYNIEIFQIILSLFQKELKIYTIT